MGSGNNRRTVQNQSDNPHNQQSAQSQQNGQNVHNEQVQQSQVPQFNGFKVGSVAVRKGERCKITKIHFETRPPSCTVVTLSGKVVNTEFEHLTKYQRPAKSTGQRKRRMSQSNRNDGG